MPLISMVLTDKYDSNEAAARLWTITFFYRVVDTVPSDSKSVLNVEPVVNTSGNMIISGYIVGLTWLGVVATRPLPVHFFFPFCLLIPRYFTGIFLLDSDLKYLKDGGSVLFVSEAKGTNQFLRNHVRQTVGEMACLVTRLRPLG